MAGAGDRSTLGLLLLSAPGLWAASCLLPPYERSDTSPYATDTGRAGTGASAGEGGAGATAGGMSATGGSTGGSAGSGAGAAGTAGVAGSAGATGAGGAAGAGDQGGTAGAGGQVSPCSDGVQNGSETDIDCGGSCTTKCGFGEGCSTGSDCGSRICLGGSCGCSPGTRQCSGNTPQLCSGSGAWENEVPCPADAPKCSAGACLVPSCEDELLCDDDGTSVSCCMSILLPDGTFPMGRSDSDADAFAAGGSDERPERDATVSSFYLDKFPVTVGRFRKFVEQYDGTPPAAGDGAHALIADSGWDSSWDSSLPSTQATLISNLKCQSPKYTWTDAAGPNEAYPVNCVNWYEAFAFCIWDGGRLPTEAEWEYAAAGGEENRLYPWGGDAPTASHANYYHGANSSEIAVGSTPLGNGRWGHSDLAGSMYEWALDWYASGFYTDTQSGCAAAECVNLTAASERVVRGGHWVSEGYDLRCANRMYVAPEGRDSGVGIRCARTP